MKRLLFFISASLIFSNILFANIDTVYIKSKCMNKQIPNIVITPNDYSNNEDRFPVLYLLHGAGNDCGEWLRHVPELSKYADNYNFIIVCPDGGGTSWYFDSPIDSTMKYETYISKELVNFIDSNYRTILNRNERAITGLSMGGHGGHFI